MNVLLSMVIPLQLRFSQGPESGRDFSSTSLQFQQGSSLLFAVLRRTKAGRPDEADLPDAPYRSKVHTYQCPQRESPDRKSTRLNSSHLGISYAVFCLQKKTTLTQV